MVSEVKKQALLALFASIEELKAMLDMVEGKSGLVTDGGEGSGNFNHKGRPGEVGGSSKNGGAGGSVKAKKLEDTDAWKTFVDGDEPPKRYVDVYKGNMTSMNQAVSHQLFDELGYTGLPQELPDDEYEQIVEQTGLRLLRGKSKVEYHKDLLTGAFYMGEGVSGYGTYSVETQRMGHQTAEAYGSAIVEFSLSPDSKIGEFKELEAEMDVKLDEWSKTMYGNAPTEKKIDAENRYTFFTDDRSRYFALQGYDAIEVKNKEYDSSGKQVDAASYYVILNRNKIIYPKGAKIRFGANNYVPVRDSAMLQDGGKGSGNFNHSGRPGEVGGSSKSGSGGGYLSNPDRKRTSVNPNPYAEEDIDDADTSDETAADLERYRSKHVNRLIGAGDSDSAHIALSISDYCNLHSYEIRHKSTPEYEKKNELIERYLAEAPLWDGPIYKGKSMKPEKVLEILERGEMSMPMIESWTEDTRVAMVFAGKHGKGERVLFQVEKPKSAVPVAYYSDSYREKEIVMPSDRKYKVRGSHYDGVFYYISLEEVNAPVGKKQASDSGVFQCLLMEAKGAERLKQVENASDSTMAYDSDFE